MYLRNVLGHGCGVQKDFLPEPGAFIQQLFDSGKKIAYLASRRDILDCKELRDCWSWTQFDNVYEWYLGGVVADVDSTEVVAQ